MSDELLDDDDVLEGQSDEPDIETSDGDSEKSVEFISDASSSLAAKQLERQRLEAEVQAFLAKGGQIQVVEPNVLADPPRKPESNYGGQPI